MEVDVGAAGSHQHIERVVRDRDVVHIYVVVVGGLGSILGAFLAALLIAIVHAFGIGVPIAVAILMWMPHAVLGFNEQLERLGELVIVLAVGVMLADVESVRPGLLLAAVLFVVAHDADTKLKVKA